MEILQILRGHCATFHKEWKHYKHYNGNIIDVTMEIPQIPRGNCVTFQSG